MTIKRPSRSITDETDQDGDGQASRLRWLLGIMTALLIPVLVIWWPGCRQYPEVSSKESLKLMRALYTACSSQSSTRLTKVEQAVEKAHRAGQMSEPELQSFRTIIAQAREGQWETATAASYRFARDQVR